MRKHLEENEMQADIAENGYRLLRRGEIKQAGDEWKYLGDKEWKLVINIGDEFRDLQPDYLFVRRKRTELPFALIA